MYATVTRTQGEVPDVSAVAAMAGETMLQWLREIEGFAGLVLLTNDDGRAEVITFWDSQDVAERHMAARLQLRDRIVTTVNVEVSFAQLRELREPEA
jgi:heme-degrading monooxygenase HmoA